MDKPILRKLMIEKRHEYMEEDKKNSNKIIFDKLKNILTQYENIGSYYNFDDEVDTVNINNWILANNKNLYLPKVNNGKIDFYKVNDLKDVHEGTFGVMEPNADHFTDINNIECIIVPMVAFNNENYRLGFGKAHYDFAFPKPNL